MWGQHRLVVRQAHAIEGEGVRPGNVNQVDGFPSIATGSGRLMLDVVQLAGRKEMPGEAFVRGAKDFIGTMLETDI